MIEDGAVDEKRQEIDVETICQALALTQGNVHQAAARLGIRFETFMALVDVNPEAQQLVRSRSPRGADQTVSQAPGLPEEFVKATRKALKKVAPKRLIEAFPGLVKGLMAGLIAEQQKRRNLSDGWAARKLKHAFDSDEERD